MNRSQKLIEKLTALASMDEKMYIHSFNRNTHRNPGTTSDPLDFHPAVGAEAAAYGSGSLVSHIKNDKGETIKTHVVKQSKKNPNSYEHHVYKFNKSGEKAGSVKHHTMTTHHSQADAVMNANRSSADRLVRRATHAAKTAVVKKVSTAVKKDAPSFAKNVLKSMTKSVLGM